MIASLLLAAAGCLGPQAPASCPKTDCAKQPAQCRAAEAVGRQLKSVEGKASNLSGHGAIVKASKAERKFAVSAGIVPPRRGARCATGLGLTALGLQQARDGNWKGRSIGVIAATTGLLLCAVR